MTDKPKTLMTRSGEITFPTYIPVTTFGKKYPLDDLIRPYLPRLAQAVMVSLPYAKQMAPDQRPSIPMFVDSGGFASLFKNASVIEKKGLGILEIQKEEGNEQLHPKDVLAFQEEIADVAFTLDFPIPPKMDQQEAEKRLNLSISNAIWTIENRRRKDLPLYACIQAWDEKSATYCAKELAKYPFEGFAIGGLVPRVRNLKLVLSIVTAVKEEIGNKPLHVLGIGNPKTVQILFRKGVDSVDSSSYVKYAAEGKSMGEQQKKREVCLSQFDKIHIALSNLWRSKGNRFSDPFIMHHNFR